MVQNKGKFLNALIELYNLCEVPHKAIFIMQLTITLSACYVGSLHSLTLRKR